MHSALVILCLFYTFTLPPPCILILRNIDFDSSVSFLFPFMAENIQYMIYMYITYIVNIYNIMLLNDKDKSISIFYLRVNGTSRHNLELILTHFFYFFF